MLAKALLGSCPLNTIASATAATLALLAAPAQAGPSQASITPPGGFASACASEITAGISYTPGLDLTAAFGGWVGRSMCQSQVFDGAAGQASAAAQWSADGVDNHSWVQAGMGQIHLQASNTARGNLQFPAAVSGGGWSESMVVNLAGHNGQSAVWLFDVDVGGTMSTGGALARVQMTAYKNKVELMSNVAGFDRGGSDPAGTDRQRVNWGVSRSGNRTIVDQVRFAVPITLGQSFEWGAYATANAGMASYGSSNAVGTVTLDFSHTLRYAGSAGVLLGGVVYNDISLVSASGIDWHQAAPVPEPAGSALWLAGLGAVGWLVWRRSTPRHG